MRRVLVVLLLVGCSAKPQPTAVKQAEAVYKAFIPFAASQRNHYKGLAMADMHHPEDLTALNVSWWYVWGWWTQNGAVPMVREMQAPPSCQPYILVGNEPDAQEPEGYPVTPANAANKVRAIETQCPASVLIVGNITGDGLWWLTAFLEKYEFVTGAEYTGGVGVHCYQWAGECLAKLAGLRNAYTGEMWVTEFNDFSGDAGNFAVLLNYIAANFDRWAVFTNRQLSGPGFIGGSLVHDDGTLDPRGLIYSEQ